MWHYLQKKFSLSLCKKLSKRQTTFFKLFFFIVSIEFVLICCLLTVKQISNFKLFNKSKDVDVYFDLTNLNTTSWKKDIEHIKSQDIISKPNPLRQVISKKKLESSGKNIKKSLKNKVNPKLNTSNAKDTTIKTTAVKKHNISKSSKNVVKNNKSSNKSLKKGPSAIVNTKNNNIAKLVKPVKLVKASKIIEKTSSKKEEIKSIVKEDVSKDAIPLELPKQLNLKLSDIDLNLNLESYKTNDTSEIENLLKCAQQVKHEIYKHWRIPKGLIKNLSLELEYFINSYGKAEKVSVLKSSGKRNYDQLLKAAIYRSTFPKELFNLNIIIKF